MLGPRKHAREVPLHERLVVVLLGVLLVVGIRDVLAVMRTAEPGRWLNRPTRCRGRGEQARREDATARPKSHPAQRTSPGSAAVREDVRRPKMNETSPSTPGTSPVGWYRT